MLFRSSKMPEPITTPEEVSGILKTSLADKNVPEAELPPAAVKALRAEPEAPRPSGRLTDSELRASQFANKFLHSGMSESDVRSAMANLGYAPKQIDSILGVVRGVSEKPQGLTSAKVTRIRNDVYDAAVGAKDGAVKSALFDAYEKLTNVQESAFEKEIGRASCRERV